MSISFESTDVTVNEEDGVVEVCVASNHSIETTVIISVRTEAGTADCKFSENDISIDIYMVIQET